MLFVSFMTPKPPSTSNERTKRRLDWKYPEQMRVIAEYWLADEHPQVVLISEGDDAATMIQAINQWDDMFDIKVVPAIHAEAGLAGAREMFSAAVA